jgi:tRNA (5-methylaminomethyl-2-thiouridylate)-methyltransferase
MTIAVLLSGGVDSSVALHLLRRQGHQIRAFYLKIWLEDELAHLGTCPWEEDLAYTSEVCRAAGVPLEVVPLQREYHEKVVRWAIDELRAGRTPSPDVLCNQRVKFGAFLDLLDEQAPGVYEAVASGHYARLAGEGDAIQLLRGRDPVKDQTYFLFQLDRRQLRRCLFPVGALWKSEVRRLAAELNLPNRDRKDSQGICFLGKIRFEDFVRGHLGDRPGPIRRVPDGKLLGRHRGHHFFTVGQRKGLGLGGGPYFVVRKDIVDDTVWVCHGDDLHGHGRDFFLLPQPHFIGAAPTGRVSLRVRHSPSVIGASVERRNDGSLEIRLDVPDPGIAPGQVAVLYDGEVCLGGGQIELPTPADREGPVR